MTFDGECYFPPSVEAKIDSLTSQTLYFSIALYGYVIFPFLVRTSIFRNHGRRRCMVQILTSIVISGSVTSLLFLEGIYKSTAHQAWAAGGSVEFFKRSGLAFGFVGGKLLRCLQQLKGVKRLKRLQRVIRRKTTYVFSLRQRVHVGNLFSGVDHLLGSTLSSADTKQSSHNPTTNIQKHSSVRWLHYNSCSFHGPALHLVFAVGETDFSKLWRRREIWRSPCCDERPPTIAR